MYLNKISELEKEPAIVRIEQANHLMGVIPNMIIDYTVKVKFLFDFDAESSEKRKTVNLLLTKLYQFLLTLVNENPILSQKLWHYSRKFYLCDCRNITVNYLHSKLVLTILSQLCSDKCTVYSIGLFSASLEVIASSLSENLKDDLIERQLSKRKDRECNNGSKYVLKDKVVILTFLQQLLPGKVSELLDESKCRIKHRQPEELEIAVVFEGGEEQKSDLDKFDNLEFEVESFVPLSSESSSESEDGYVPVVDNEEMKNIKKWRDCERFWLNEYILNLEPAFLLSQFTNFIVYSDNPKISKGILPLTTFIAHCIKYVSNREQTLENMMQYQFLMRFLSKVTDTSSLMAIQDVRNMFCSDTAIDCWLELITRQDDFNYFSGDIRCLSYDIIIKTFQYKMKTVRRSIMRWTDSQLNKIKLFERILNIIDYSSTLIIDEHDTYIGENTLQSHLSDMPELERAVNFLRVLCDNETVWQDYVRQQNNCVINQNLLPSLMRLLKDSIGNLHHQFAVEISVSILKLMYALVNGDNAVNEDYFVSDRIYDPINKVLKLGYYRDR